MGIKDPRVDEYIERSAPFARPILKHLRRLVHTGCPSVEETIKWGFPHFEHQGVLCSMAAFKQHCAFGFWKGKLLARPGRGGLVPDDAAMGQFGRITERGDLPGDRALLALVKRAVALNEAGVQRPVRRRTTGDRELEVPAYFMAVLRKNTRALKTFKGFSYSNRKEYVEWVVEAKGEETRRRRLETAVEWMAEGKIRNWKYVRK